MLLGALLLPSSTLLAQYSVSLSSANTSSGGTVSLAMSVATPSSSQLAALSWTFVYPAAQVSSLNVTAGSAATAAGKSLTCLGGSGFTMCILSGLNSTAIAGGVLANVSVTLSGGSPATLTFDDLAGVSGLGDPIIVTGTGGTAGVTSAPVSLSGVSCNPGSVGPGSTSTCTVTLSGAPGSGPASVSLGSSSATVTVPASVSVAANSSTATFTANIGQFSASQNVTITATYNSLSKTASLSLVPPATVTVSSLQCVAVSLGPNSNTSCTVTISQNAPAAGTTVTITNSAPSALSAPTSVNVLSGATTISFTATTGAVTADQNVTLTAALNGSTKSNTISLVSPVTVSALQCAAASLLPNISTTCTITLSKPAVGDTVTIPVSSSSTALTVPASVPIANGATTTTFTARAGTFTVAQTAIITATLGSVSRTFSMALNLLATPTLFSVNCIPRNPAPGSTGKCGVVLSGAWTGASPAVISLSSSQSALQLPATVSILPAMSNVVFTFTTTAALAGSVTITAAFQGISKSSTLTVAVSGDRATQTSSLVSLSCPKSIQAGTRGVCELRLGAESASGAEDIGLLVDSNGLKVPESLRADAGDSALRFEVTADADASEQAVTIEARSGDSRVEQTVSLRPAAGPRIGVPGKQWGKTGSPLQFTIAARGAALVTAAGLPPTARFDSASGIFEWTPGSNEAGTREITFVAVDAAGMAAQKTVAIQVGNGEPIVNGPVVCGPGPARMEGYFLSGGAKLWINGVSAQVLDSSLDHLDFVCPALPAGSSLDLMVETAAGRSALIAGRIDEASPQLITVDDSGQAAAGKSGGLEWAGLPTYRFHARPVRPGDAVTALAAGIGCDSTAQAHLKVGALPVSIESIAPASQTSGACALTFHVPAGVAGDTVPMVLEVLRADGKVAASNAASIAVEPR